MTITYLTTKPPQLSNGSEVRNYQLLDSLLQSSMVTHVNLIYFELQSSESQPTFSFSHPKVTVYVFPLYKRTLWRSLGYFVSGHIPYVEYLKQHGGAQIIIDAVNQSQLCFLSELDAYLAVEPMLAQFHASVKLVLDCHNVDYRRFKAEIETGTPLVRLVGHHLPGLLQTQEIQALRTVHLVLACSAIDKAYFQTYIPASKIAVVPNGVILPSAKPTHRLTQKNTLLFMGLLSYLPNTDALHYYFAQIHPLILAQAPQTKIKIIGKNPPAWLKTLAQADASIELLGFVTDVQDQIQTAAVCLCPLRYGSGTRLKILEYAAAAKPIVSTTIGAEGLDLRPGRDLLLADTPEQFAQEVVDLLKNPRLASHLGNQAFKTVTAHYDWHLIGTQLVQRLATFTA